MAGELSWLGELGKSTAAGFSDVVFFAVIFLVIGGLGAFIWWIMSFKHEVVIRYVTGNRKFIIKEKAKSIKQDGATLWRLFKMKETVMPPPPESLEITKKGKFFAECLWSEENPSPVWLVDGNEPHDAFKKSAFTADERTYYVSRGRRALDRKRMSGWEKIMQVALPAAAIIVMAIPFIFFGNLTEESTEMASANTKTAEQLGDNLESIERLTNNLARIMDAEGIEIKQEIPPEIPPEVTG